VSGRADRSIGGNCHAAARGGRRAARHEPRLVVHRPAQFGPIKCGARAFAAALQCGSGGCGKCTACRTSLSGSHPDVTLVRTELLSIGVDEVRELVRRSAMSPTLPSARPWDGVVVIEDADRITERGADALLRASRSRPLERCGSCVLRQ
jgi:DNA polymerase-3 subunit delta'